MTAYRAGEIVLIAFPYSNAGGAKQRPALVLADTGDADLIVARITSRLFTTRFDALIVDWQQAGLLVPSVVRVHKLATLEKRLVRRVLGILSSEDWDSVRTRIRELWSSLWPIGCRFGYWAQAVGWIRIGVA